MGSTLWVEIRGLPLKETADDCSKMNRLADEFDALATRLGVRKLSDFFDYTEMGRAADAELEALEIGDEPPADASEGDGDDVGDETVRDATAESPTEREAVGEWFDSAEGLATVRALSAYLADHASELKMPTSPGDAERYRRELLDELRLCDGFLARAASSARQFRFLLVP